MCEQVMGGLVYFKRGVLLRYTANYTESEDYGSSSIEIVIKSNFIFDNRSCRILHEIDLEDILKNYKDAEDRINRLFPRNRYNR